MHHNVFEFRKLRVDSVYAGEMCGASVADIQLAQDERNDTKSDLKDNC